ALSGTVRERPWGSTAGREGRGGASNPRAALPHLKGQMKAEAIVERSAVRLAECRSTGRARDFGSPTLAAGQACGLLGGYGHHEGRGFRGDRGVSAGWREGGDRCPSTGRIVRAHAHEVSGVAGRGAPEALRHHRGGGGRQLRDPRRGSVRIA